MSRRLPFPSRLAWLLLPAAFVALAALSARSQSAAARTAPASAPRSFYETPYERKPDFKTLVALGRSLFSDRALSASGRVSCASCHDPAHAYGPPNRLPVQLGGAAMNLPGVRAVPSLTYHQGIPNFQEHFFDNDGNDSEDQGPTGGLDWDGRADSGHEQAAGPLLSAFEMGNASPESIVAKLRASPDAAAMRDAFGPHVLDDPKRGWNGLLLALEVFQQSPADFYPYNSKYDAFLRGQVKLSRRGGARPGGVRRQHAGKLRVVPHQRDQARRVPAVHRLRPHRHRRAAQPAPSPPTRSPAIATWARAARCAPTCRATTTTAAGSARRRCATWRRAACSSTTAPTASSRTPCASTRCATRIRRASTAGGHQFDDLPAKYQGNLNRELPFGAKPGDKPTLTEAEIADVVAFLKTLTDGYVATPADAATAPKKK